uniref:HTH La-type RNA-binding domain-containing protein n=1 Tax=Pyrodinium bahamense TaxID=73915 RepID=A0A7S0AMF2_9DINO|mmetsp:Transcript_37534/g.104363  ORF Transcript_37534/g.104363 Transcript_37534/m.104363 type:complete len:551 (+) Transcript_37534:79-1731(+)|eukprot:CAMPEP_0179020394 /NCGR_PEP_ID=MMETSP0796-20121207/5356_1 /TAXON_ID=73915 /ORGANISM="Pyrodinium bahamense, Strain pbaha01" /LENGTH=550 /DNA_ID=CAMNT_0020716201 /DNA_START=8 /DNA_END=1660 /DNA_ORIENTATION=+
MSAGGAADFSQHMAAVGDPGWCYAPRRKGRWRHEGSVAGNEQRAPGTYEDQWIFKTQQQIEYYFSNKNLASDVYLLKVTGPCGTGFVSVDELSNFNRLKQISRDSGMQIKGLVHAAATRSPLLAVSDDGACVRRLEPLPEVGHMSDHLCRMVAGSDPNIDWRAVTMDALRDHARFLALPSPSCLVLSGPAAWRWVRQDDRLWEELHWGVLSTRHLQGVLGFHEPRSVEFLGLTRHMVSHHDALAAFHDLLAAPEAAAWHQWAAKPQLADQFNEQQRRAYNAKLAQKPRVSPAPRAPKRRRGGWTGIGQVRCAWGSAQEATALLKLLEAKECSGCVMEEVGLCVLDMSQQGALLPLLPGGGRDCGVPAYASRLPGLLGASPDAMLRFPDGVLAAIEVKNVCPFFAHNGALAVHSAHVPLSDRHLLPHWRLRGPAESVPAAYVPQAQWEMFVSGTHKLLFVSASALQGSTVFLLERDDSYVELLLRFIGHFYCDFVLVGRPPGGDFFWGLGDYQALLLRTRAICSSTPVHFRIPPDSHAEACARELFFDAAL